MASKAKQQRLPKKYDKTDCDLAACPGPDCDSTATRFVFQHLCDTKKEEGYVAKVTWEVPAYVLKADKEKSFKWKCPVCNKQEVAPVLIKCGECGRVAKASQT